MENNNLGYRAPNARALLPIGVFLVLYLGSGLLFEYGLKIEMGFYQTPAIVVFLIALLVACVQNRALNFDAKLKVMANGVADENILTMCLVFLTAGAFSGAISAAGGADSTVYLFLSYMPPQLAVAGLFLIACFVSLSMGTSTGTISALAPFAVSMSQATGFDIVLCIAAVASGAMFGDNLSMISDTTIAATRSQGCEMRDKFRANFKIALPAAVVTLVVILVQSLSAGVDQIDIPEYNLLLLIPYILVLFGGIVGLNVFVVLLVGILAGVAIVLPTGTVDFMSLLGSMGSGAAGMFETIMVTVLVSAMCALIREHGGFEALLAFIRRVFKGRVGGRLGVGLLVGAMDIATANNTVAIVMANPIAKEMSEEYGVTPRKTASLLDTFSCVFQGVIPYGAQMLVAISAASELGFEISAFDIIPNLFYPGFLLISSLIFIFVLPSKQEGKSSRQ